MNNGDGTGSLVFNDTSADFLDVPFTLTATENNVPISTSINLTIHANPAPPKVIGYSSGPLAFIVGLATPQPPPTVMTDSTANVITLRRAFAFFPWANLNWKTNLPTGLSFTNNANGSISIAGTPAPGTGGSYKIPITLSKNGVQSIAVLDIVVYEAPTFPIYTGTNAFVFRTGTPSVATIAALSGFPLSPFQGQDPTLGSSVGLVYALNSTAQIDSSNNIVGTPFSLANGLTGLGNGTFTISYNGQPLSSGNPYTLSLAAQVETGYVPISASGSQLYIDQAPVTAQLYVAPPGDANLDGSVTCADYDLVKAAIGASPNTTNYSTAVDMNGDGVINLKDLLIVAHNLPQGTICH